MHVILLMTALLLLIVWYEKNCSAGNLQKSAHLKPMPSGPQRLPSGPQRLGGIRPAAAAQHSYKCLSYGYYGWFK